MILGKDIEAVHCFIESTQAVDVLIIVGTQWQSIALPFCVLH